MASIAPRPTVLKGLRGAPRGRLTLPGVLRTLTFCLLAVLASGAVPVASTCLEEVRGCGSQCMRCACKRRPLANSLRAPCPCCRPQPGTQPITLLGPAILQDVAASFMPPADAPVRRDFAGDVPSFARPVPHPPPRTLPLA
jgi:hypothetical protein